MRPDWVRKIAILLDALNSAQRADDVNVVGSGFHALTGNLAGRYAMTISRNWRLTFGWSGEDATDVDLEDYHG